jgi:hypothetical protein
MKRLALAAAVLIAGCGQEAEPPKDPGKSGTVKTPQPNKDPGKTTDKPADKPKIVRKVVDPAKKGLLATYRCQCTDKTWTQPAEEEKLCIEYCEGKMPECGEFIKEEPAPK